MSVIPTFSASDDASALRDKLKEAASTYTSIRSKEQMSDEDKNNLRQVASFIAEFDPVEKAMSRLADEEAERSNKRDVSQSRGPRAANDAPVQRQRSVLDQMIEDDRFKEFVRSGRSNEEAFTFTADASSFGQRALITEGNPITGAYGDLVEGAGVLVGVADPVFVSPRTRRLFLRELINAERTDKPAVPYIQELNPAVNELGASAVGEGNTKPEVTLEFIERISPVRKIAAWIPVTTEIIEDAPMLRAYINTRLDYMIRLREEIQLISGPGTSANLLGIINQVDENGNPAIQLQSNVGTNDLPATVAMAIGKLENVDGEADALVVNPLTYWAAQASRHATHFDGGAGTAGAPGTETNLVWGLPTVRSRGLSTGQFLTGWFRAAAQIWDRADLTIRVGTQHADYMIHNKELVLGEKRLALVVYRPEHFVLGTVNVDGD